MQTDGQNETADRNNKNPQILHSEDTHAQGEFFQFSPELHTDAVIKQNILIREMGIVRCTIDTSPTGNILHRNRPESLLSYGLHKSSFEVAPGPGDTRICFSPFKKILAPTG